MNLSDLLLKQGIDPSKVGVMRHKPWETGLSKVLPWLIHENPAVFNAYQQKHSGPQERSLAKMVGDGYLASFVGIKPKQAVFAGLYRIQDAKEINYQEFWEIPENQVLKALGMADWEEKERGTRRIWFDLVLEPFHQEWCGRLVIAWPGKELAWWRRAEKNDFTITSIHEESLFTQSMPDWHKLNLSWIELQAIPTSWRSALSHWRGIYFIHDSSDGKGYVGSAYGNENLLGRWLNYASSGHGDNKLLKPRNPENFHFSILQRVSPDLEAEEIIRLESSWKDRLHTRGAFGLNEN